MKAYKKNCKGDFFVEEGACTLCQAPEDIAPNLIMSDNTSCYFYKQPETEEEIDQALKAMESSCCADLVYNGTDPVIIKKAKENKYIEIACILNA